MFEALLAGMMDNNKTVSDVQGNCSAEACKWESYTTLAICNTVEDIPSGLRFSNDTLRLSGVSWDPPQLDYGGDTSWMTAPLSEKYWTSSSIENPFLEDGHLNPVANMFVAYVT